MDEKVAQNFLQNIFTTWLNPELVRRREKKSAPPNLFVRKAQIIFLLDGRQDVRFNDEVRAYILTNKGVASTSQNFDEEGLSIERLDRSEDEKDFAHVTILRVRELWVIAFDFSHRITDSKKIFELGKEYLETAILAFRSKKYKSSVANLYIASVNLCKARIFLYPDLIARKTKKHGQIAGRINIHSSNTGIINDKYSKIFNKLQEFYNKARFVPSSKFIRKELSETIRILKLQSKEIEGLYNQKVIYRE
ncbi:hypothetical protein A3D07_01275 [Candidatus Curtissbacteria bacterium RIFCSPHIGHO2_02_FULL_42_15]|uniref:Uncharacterized protein n=1 Tax=Candidatus Curtissbacteria bacterium RIFCSPHIGHO2_02_FULL_42_15 TaxID=1797716 RepID=A0A1F5GJT8_9BACT|nr:MAG: hypothetical protein A3D07_01275 [Candidatus Curtissbacteria bacterium RIFCSPHIGHO2_02_FULL_42_15]